MKLEKINRGELKLLGEIPLLFKLRLKKIFGKKAQSDGGILAIDVCIIGDFVGTLPALRTFIENQGEEVDLVVIPPLKSLAQSIRGVRKVFTAKSMYQRTNENYEKLESMPANYSQVMVLRISPETYQRLNSIKYSKIEIYDIPYFKYCGHLVKTIMLRKEFKQWSEVNFEMVGIKKPDRKIGFDDIFSFSESDYARVGELPEMDGTSKKIIIHTGSGWNVKLWDNDKWIELIRKINTLGDFKFILIGASDLEEKSFNYIQNHLDFKIFSLINRVDLKTILLVMRYSDYFIGIDSGPRNLAHLADLRSITMLGPAPKNFMPMNKNDIVIDKFTCKCKSLYYLHKESAMQKISAEEVFEGFMRLSKTDRPHLVYQLG
ncbi:MAG: glycosyltransferase family 9 protein [Bacteroidota bacterium]